jgi:hypothetical protein
MLKKLTILIVLVALLAACQPSPEAMQLALEQTLAAMPTFTPYPTYTPPATYTPYPTNTLEPTFTPSPTNTLVPSPTATRKPTITPTPSMGSSTSPIPFGTPMPLVQSGTKKFDLSVTQFIRGLDAWMLVYGANMFNDQAPTNREWACSYLVLSYTSGPSGEMVEIDENYFNYVSTGQVIEIPFHVKPEPAFDDIMLLPGGSAEGWLCGHIATTDTAPMLVFGFVSGKSAGFYFSLTAP